MSKKRRKSTVCLNCKFPLRPEDNYCPNCGQENDTHNIPLKHLVFEIFEDFFHFDTKLWNTIKASFIKPGKITIDYLEGKRASYVPPVKFYVFVSFIFFLLLAKVSNHSISHSINVNISSNKGHNGIAHKSISINELLGNKKEYYSKDSNDVKMLEFEFESKDSLLKQIKYLKDAPDSALNKLLIDQDFDSVGINRKNLRGSLALIPEHCPALDSIKPTYNIYNKVKFEAKEEYDKFKENIRFYTDNQVDSLLISKGETASWFNRQMVKKLGKIDRLDNDDTKYLMNAILNSISLTMFVMMPVTAILLLLIFYRKKYYYEHLIFSIHIHTIFFLIFSVILAIQVFISQSFADKLWLWSFLLCFIYLVVALRNSYKQSWGKTIFKLMLMSVPYLIISVILIIAAVIYGFLA